MKSSIQFVLMTISVLLSSTAFSYNNSFFYSSIKVKHPITDEESRNSYGKGLFKEQNSFVFNNSKYPTNGVLQISTRV